MIGVTGTATFNQSGGSNVLVGAGTITGTTQGYNNHYGTLIVGAIGGYQAYSYFAGNAVGTYNLSGGYLGGDSASSNNGGELIGSLGGTGIFTQTGGVNAPTYHFFVGGSGGYQPMNPLNKLDSTSAYGSYSLQGGLLNPVSTEMENIGVSGTGIFTQTAGTNVTSGILLGGAANVYDSLGNQTPIYTPGTYTLNGGLLQTAAVNVNTVWQSNNVNLTSPPPVSYATFAFNGGTLQATGPLNVNVTTALGGVGTLDIAGNPLTFDVGGRITALDSSISLTASAPAR